MKTPYTPGPIQSFEEETLQALLDKEGHLVELGTADGTVKLATSAAAAIGVLDTRTSLESKAVSVRMFGSGGTFRGKAGGAIAKGARITWGTGGKFVTQPTSTGAYITHGRKITQGNSADGDIIEIHDAPLTIVVP